MCQIDGFYTKRIKIESVCNTLEDIHFIIDQQNVHNMPPFGLYREISTKITIYYNAVLAFLSNWNTVF